jgi:phosphatidylethanolamine-binding protein (PEBP) family uncharacterized protein
MPRRKTRRLKRSKKRGGSATTVPIADSKSLAFPATLSVLLGDGASAAEQIVSLQAAKPEPRVSWPGPPSPFYTLMVIDPDAPAKPAWLHWLIVNIDGSSTATGETLVSWAPPSPPSGIHRYYACLFRHEARVVAPAPKERGYFRPAEFIATNGLQPVAAALWRVRAPKPGNSVKPL